MRTGPKNVCWFLPRSRLSTTGGIWAVRIGGGTKTNILSVEHDDALAVGLPKLREAICSVEPAGGSGCKSRAFRLNLTRSRRMARLYVDSQYISLKQTYIDYLSRLFNVVQHQLRDYIVAM